MDKVIGIDISKQTFDASWIDGGTCVSMVFPNSREGFTAFSVHVGGGDHCVMEASGPYSLQLATFLHSRGVCVSVVNPLVVKRYCQMRMSRAKTDKKDAAMIRDYGRTERPAPWEPAPAFITEMNSIVTALEGYEKIATQLSNQQQAGESLGTPCGAAHRSRHAMLAHVHGEIALLTAELETIAGEHCGENLARLETIPGIGTKTALLLIAVTGNFENFDNVRALVAYCGLSPRVHQSGSSVRGKGRLCKMGNGRVRKMLYMCTWSAQKHNPQCRELKERLTAKGKPPRVVKVAMANKLLRLAFGVAKSKTDYSATVGLKAA